MMNNKSNWVSNVKDLLHRYHYGDMWENPYWIVPAVFIHHFKQRIFDCYVQERPDSINNNAVLDVYKHRKTIFGYEMYYVIYR